MKCNSRKCFVILFALLIAVMVSVPVYGDDPPWPISYEPPSSLFPIMAVVDVKEGVIIGPFAVSSSMAGTVTLTSPSGQTQTLSVKLGNDGFSGDVNLTELGTYQIQENYTLTIELSFSSIPLRSQSFSKTHEWSYKNQTAGIKTFNVTSSLSNFSADIQGYLEIYSVEPSIVEPGGESVTFMLRSLADVKKDDLFVTSVTLSSLWDKVASITLDNSPPSVSISSAVQSFSDTDVRISFNLQDLENALCIMDVEYKLSTAALWSSAAISEAHFTPGPGELYWKAPLDQPNGKGIYNVRMRASDRFSYSSWASRSFRLTNTAAVDNNPPSAVNVHIITMDGFTNQEVDRDPITGDKLKAQYTFFDSDTGDTEHGSQLRWYKFGVLQESVTVNSEQSKILTESIHKGESWYFEIIPSDGKTSGDARKSSTVTIGNAPPYVQAVRILPISPTAKDDLQASYDFFDPDDDPEGASEIRWYKNGILQPFQSNLTLPASATTRGDKWSFSIRPRDLDGGTGTLVDSTVVTVINQKPVVAITSVSVSEATGNVTVMYDLSDADGDLCKLSIWYQGGAVGLAKTAAHVTEATEDNHVITNVFPAIGLTFTWESKKDQPSGKADDFRIGIKPNDGMDNGNETVSQRFSLDNNSEPVAANVVIAPPSPFSSDDLTAAYNFSDPDGDEESKSEIKWYRNNLHQSDYDNLQKLPNTATKRDENWHFTVRPSDGKELGKIQTSSIVKINNAPPLATEVKLEPEAATSDDNLKAVYTYNDADGDAESGTQIRWYLNDSLQAGYNDLDLIPSTDTVKGQVWYFTIRPSDGVTPGQLVKSNQVALGNVVPEVRGLTIPPEGFRDVTIQFDLVDVDGDECSLKVDYRGGMANDWVQATIKEPLFGVTPGLITLTWESAKDEDVQKPIKFQIRVTPNDGLVEGKTVETGFFTLDNNIPPTASNLSISPPNPTTADNLIASYDYSDADGGQESGSEIIWSRNGVKTSNKGRTLLASATSKGQDWSFTLRPRDGAKFGDPHDSLPVTIFNTPPLARNVVIAPAEPKSGDFLTVRYDYQDVDEDRENSTEIEWYKNGAIERKVVVVADEDRRLPVAVLKGDRWYAVVRPMDGTNFGDPVTSPSVSVDNAIPIVQDITVSGDSGDVAITYTLIDGDEDPCELEVNYQGGSVSTAWTLATIKETTTKVLPGIGLRLTWVSNVDEGGQKATDYKVRITPRDSVSVGVNGLSSTFTLNNNTVPTAVELAILPELPGTDNDLTVSYMFVDLDGDKEGKPEINWYKNSVMEVLYNNLTVLPASATSKGDRWYYTIKVSDGKETSKTLLSPHVNIGNAAPYASNIVLSPEQPMIGQQLVAQYTYTDVDGDSEDGTQITWYRNGAPQSKYDNFITVPSVAVIAGDEWYFTVMPKDGFDFGIPQASNKVYISNLPPFASSLSISPAVPQTMDNLVASYIYTDPENDPEEGSKIVWYKNSVAQTSYNDMVTLPASATIKNQVWHFEVQPKDGKQYGSSQKSNFVVIKNTPPRIMNLSLSPPYPLSSDDLVANYDYSDADGDVEVRSEIWWYRNDIQMRAYDGLKKLPSKETLNGQIWRFTIRPKDGIDFGELMSSSSVEIGSPIPRVNNLFVIPKIPLTTDALEANYIYTDPNGVPESGSEIKWYKDGVSQIDYSNARILPGYATSKGELWYFSVKPSNGRQFGEEQSSAHVTIVNSVPTLALVKPQPATPTTDDVIIVDYIFDDPDGDAETGNEIKWFRDGVLQPFYNDLTELPASATKRDEKWHFTIRSMDGTVFSDLVTSSSVTIGNGIPGITNINLIPVDPLTSNDLKLSYTYIDTENDQESGSEIRWFRDDVHEPAYNNAYSVPSAATARDEQWYCTVRPSDGIDFGEVISSPVLTIGNTRPVVVEILALSEQVLRGDSVLIASFAQDEDSVDSGPALKGRTEFRIGGGAWTEIPTEYVQTPTARWEAAFSPDTKAQLGEYDFRVAFTDAAGGESDWSIRLKAVTVINNLPEIGIALDDLHVPEDTVKEFDLYGDNVYGSDLEDGRTLSWELDSDSVDGGLFQVSVSSNRFLEIKPVDDKHGQDDVTIKLTDTDGGEAVKTDVTIIIDPVNDPPTATTSVRIDPVNPKTSDNLVCTAEGSSDVDGDVVVYRYQWYKDGEPQTDLRANNVSQSSTSKGETWRCEIIPSDGESDGPVRTAEVTIGNTSPEVSIRKTTGNIGDILITLDLRDSDNDDCDLKVEHQVKGKSWKTSTVRESLRGVKPGVGLTLTWLSNEDEANVLTDDCKIRITPNDGTQSAAPGESASFFLDNKSPEFALTAVANPIHTLYVDVTVVSSEELDAAPVISAVLEDEETVVLDMQSIGDVVWTGKLELKSGFIGSVAFTVEGTDMVGNDGKMELQKEFQTPSPLPRPDVFALKQNYPNPVGKETYIPYQLSESSQVTVEIYNIIGQLVRTLDEGYQVAGFYLSKDKAAYWDGNDDHGIMVASGVYFYYLKAGDSEGIRKMAVKR